jgi:molybdopterin molybdotransferase
MSHGDTKDDGNNPPSPPFSKGGISANFPFDKGRNPLIPPLEKGDTGGFSGDTGYIADPVFGKSGLISTMTRADGLIKIDINTEGLDKDSLVDVYLF